MSMLDSAKTLVSDLREAELASGGSKGEGLVRFPAHMMIEPSYACNLKCAFCPRHFDDVPQGLLKMEFFRERIEPALKQFKYVSFVGWGEPLLNSSLPDFLGASASAGCFTLIITNGVLLRGAMAERILASGMDMVCVSIDAADPATYELVRGKGTFPKVLENVRAFSRMRTGQPKKPILSWVFIMMKYNLRELPRAVELAAEAGFDRFYAKHLECVTDKADLAQARWNTGLAPDLTSAEQAEYEDMIGQAQQLCERHGLELMLHRQRHSPDGQCTVYPLDNIFVDWQGYVSPCCYLNRLDMRPYQKEKPAWNGVLGTIEQVSLVDLIHSPLYSNFQNTWNRSEVPEACKGCLNVYRMKTSSPA